MPKLQYFTGEQINVDSKESILEAAIRSKIDHMHECGGFARCTTCRVEVISGKENLDARTKKEAQIAATRKWPENIRLACQARVAGDVLVRRLLQRRSDLLTRLLYEDATAGTERSLAVMFCDLRNFTSISETMLPHDVMYLINRYTTECSEAILQNDGLIDKYIGDGIMALFGLEDKNSTRICQNAVRAALNIQVFAKRLTEELQDSFAVPIRVGVGIHFGLCVVGTLGHPSRRSLSVLGDTVNVASRIESATKEVKTPILISAQVEKHLSDRYQLGQKTIVNLKGKSHKQTIYPVLGPAQDDPLLVVQQTFSSLFAQWPLFGTRFYKHLFALRPGTKELFSNDLSAQIKIFTSMLESTVSGACRPDRLASGLFELGQRHAAYQLTEIDYEIARQAILMSLKDTLGTTFDQKTEKAWSTLLLDVTGMMVRGATKEKKSI